MIRSFAGFYLNECYFSYWLFCGRNYYNIFFQALIIFINSKCSMFRNNTRSICVSRIGWSCVALSSNGQDVLESRIFATPPLSYFSYLFTVSFETLISLFANRSFLLFYCTSSTLRCWNQMFLLIAGILH